jgi:hypothetical protein
MPSKVKHFSNHHVSLILFSKSNFTFPKNIDKNVTKLMAFGDWSICEYGNYSKAFIEKNLNTTDAVVYLGDLAYDLDTDNGEKGNTFLEYARNVSSKVPFMVLYL